jgi:hypothetical protein
MESIPNLLYLKRRTWPRQIPPTEMRLAKGQVKEYAISLSQNPKYASADQPDYDQRFNVQERRWTAEPKDFVNLFCAVIYDLLWRILYTGEGVLAKDVVVKSAPTQTSPLAVIMASIVPMNYACVSPKGPLSVSNRKVFTLIDHDIESAVLERQVTDVHHEP